MGAEIYSTSQSKNQPKLKLRWDLYVDYLFIYVTYKQTFEPS